MRNLFLIATLTAAVAACGGKQSTSDAPTSQPTTDPVEEVAAPASVRFVHASQAAPIRVYAGDVQLTSAPVGTGQWGGRLEAPAGDHSLSFRPAGGGEAFAAVDTTFESEGSYTVIFAGDDTSRIRQQMPTAFTFEDDLSAPPAGQARVRFFHGVPTAGPVSLSDSAGRGYVAGLAYGAMSGWYDVAPSGAQLSISADGATVATVTAPLTPDMLTTVLIVSEGGAITAKFLNEPAN